MSAIKTNIYTEKQRGFTIVELLIVIVVIAILAAISIVAYDGIQDRANDAVVQSDLRNFANLIEQRNALDGGYPQGGSAYGNSTSFPGVNFAPSKKSYDTGASVNFYYCEGQKAGEPEFVVSARSKSGTDFAYESSRGVVSEATQYYSVCRTGWDVGTDSFSYGYYRANDVWWPWTS